MFWVLVLQADTVILKISCSASGTFICLAHYVGPLTGSLMGKPRGNVLEMLFFAQTVAFSLKKTQNTMNLMWLRGYYSFCFQAVRMTLNSKLQVRSLIFCLAWCLAFGWDCLKAECLEESEFKLQFRKNLISTYECKTRHSVFIRFACIYHLETKFSIPLFFFFY